MGKRVMVKKNWLFVLGILLFGTCFWIGQSLMALTGEDDPSIHLIKESPRFYRGITGPDGRVINGLNEDDLRKIAEEKRSRGITVKINLAEVEFPDARPVSVDGRVLVPLRPVFENHHVQCPVVWDEDKQEAAIYDQKGRITVIRPGEDFFQITNGDGSTRKYSLDVPAQIIDGRIMLPIRALMEAFSYKVGWLDYTFVVDIWDSYPMWRKLVPTPEWKKAIAEGADLHQVQLRS